MISGNGNNNSRTLSGLNPENSLDLPATEDAIRIAGNKGLSGQTIQKDSNNKLNWGFIDDIEIPDNSIVNAKLVDKTIEANKIKDGTIVDSLIANNTITNSKLVDKTIENGKIKDGTIIASLLASDITINTTGNISANDGKFDEIELPNTSVGANINVELNSTGIYTLNNKIIKSGGVLEGKTLLINNGDSNSLPMVVMGNGSVIGTLKSTTFQLPTTGQADDWVVRLNSTGINTTKDITALGIITGEDGKFDEIECPKTGSPDVIITDSGITTSSGTCGSRW